MNIEDQLVRDENEILHAYFDSLGYLTIGVGHLIDQRRGGSIPQSISRELLQLDIAAKKTQLLLNAPWTASLDEVRFGALLNMAFNLGVEGLLEFTHFLGFLQAGNWQAAAAAMLDSLWAKQVGDRAKRLAVQIQSGVWQ